MRARRDGEADPVDRARVAEILDEIDGFDREPRRHWLARPVRSTEIPAKSGPNGVGAAVDTSESLEEAIRAEAERLGFVACGFARADAADAAGLDLRRWLEAGHHGTMGWMEERAASARRRRWRCGPKRNRRSRWA